MTLTNECHCIFGGSDPGAGGHEEGLRQGLPSRVLGRFVFCRLERISKALQNRPFLSRCLSDLAMASKALVLGLSMGSSLLGFLRDKVNPGDA